GQVLGRHAACDAGEGCRSAGAPACIPRRVVRALHPRRDAASLHGGPADSFTGPPTTTVQAEIVGTSMTPPDAEASETRTIDATQPGNGNSPTAPAEPPLRTTSFVVNNRRYETAGLTSATFLEFQ